MVERRLLLRVRKTRLEHHESGPRSIVSRALATSESSRRLADSGEARAPRETVTRPRPDRATS